MRLYSGISKNFIIDTTRNQIADKLKGAFFDYFRYNPSPAEIRSWRNSLIRISSIFQDAELMNHGVLLEYQLPLNSKRLDCMICGRENGRDNAVIIELKQWDKCKDTLGDNEVATWVGGAMRDVLHPSAQVGSYRTYLEDTHTAFYEGENPVKLHSCAYLHNYHYDKTDILFADKFRNVLDQNPLFTMDDYDNIKDYLSGRVKQGDDLEVLKRIEESKYRPSKKLMLHVGSVIKGKPQYVLLDEQKIVYDKIMAIARKGFHSRDKHIIIVKGGPGTGKSVIAINLMADLLLNGYNAQYATGSRAFTETLKKAIGRRGAVQFKYFNSYIHADLNDIDVLICDEAHRIRETSNHRFMKSELKSDIPQVNELLKAAKVCVFFIDDRQVVRPGEIGSSDYIKKTGDKLKTSILEYTLDIQFRCSGSESFINWINNTLGIERTANVLWNRNAEQFDFRIVDTPDELEVLIREKADQGLSARMTAGFCWPWSKKLTLEGKLEDDVVIGDFKRPWNARPEMSGLPKDIPKSNLWAYEPAGINQVGCIYTAQGFEFDYAGVIFGKDLVYNFDSQSWEGNPGESHDTVVKRAKGQFIDLVKNTYRVLLSRGMKGCYVHFMDKDTERFFKSRME